MQRMDAQIAAVTKRMNGRGSTGQTKEKEAADVRIHRQRALQRFIARVAQTAPGILYVYDLIRSRLVYVNDRVHTVLGLTAPQFIRRGFARDGGLIHCDDVELFVERERRLSTLEDGLVDECVFRMKNVRSEWLWFRIRETVFARTAEGRVEQIVGIAEEITEYHSAQKELEKSQRQMRALSARLQDVRETERAAVARRVHDELGQGLTALNMELASMHRQLCQLPEDGRAMMTRKLTEMTGLVASMLQTVRTVSSELRPPVLDEFGLVAAIEWQAGEFQKKFGTRCEVTVNWRTEFQCQRIETAVFRILQEALTNVARHASASKVGVFLTEGVTELILSVQDNGRGITRTQQRQSLGILGMCEQALLFGGAVVISGLQNKGTTVTVKIPRRTIAAALAPRKERLI